MASASLKLTYKTKTKIHKLNKNYQQEKLKKIKVFPLLLKQRTEAAETCMEWEFLSTRCDLKNPFKR